MNSIDPILDILFAICGVYMIFWALQESGPLFQTKNIKKGFETKYKNSMKWFCAIGGVVSALTGVLDYFKIQPYATVSFVLLCAAVAFAFVTSIAFTVPKKIAFKNGRIFSLSHTIKDKNK